MADRGTLEGLLSDLKQNTGIEVYPCPRGGEETSFSATVAGESVTLYTPGTDERAQTAARLLSYLLCESAEHLPSKEELLRAALCGDPRQAQRFIARFRVPSVLWCVLAVAVEKRERESFEHISGCLDGEDMALPMENGHIAVIRACGGEQSSYEFGQFLSQSLYEELGVRAGVGVGGETEFGEIAVSYAQAASALRMSAVFRERGEVHSYREYLLVRMVEELPREKLEALAQQFSLADAEEILEDEVMANTAEEFLRSSLNVSEASRNLYMHRNTLLYRLDKIEAATGLNIRKFSDAVTFRLLTVLYKLLRS